MRKILRRGVARLLAQEPGTPGLVFVHLPKCGGTAVTAAIETAWAPMLEQRLDYAAARQAIGVATTKTLLSTTLPDDIDFLLYLLAYRLGTGARFTAGHYPVTARLLEVHAPHQHFVTVMRDPVDRWISQYLWNKRLPDPQGVNLPSSASTRTVIEEFDEVVASGVGLLLGSLMTSMLAGAYPQDEADAIRLSEIALQNLDHFAAVGFQDRMGDFAADVGSLLDMSLTIPELNKTDDQYVGDLDLLGEQREWFANPTTLAKITELCEADLHLYSSARAKRHPKLRP